MTRLRITFEVEVNAEGMANFRQEYGYMGGTGKCQHTNWVQDCDDCPSDGELFISEAQGIWDSSGFLVYLASDDARWEVIIDEDTTHTQATAPNCSAGYKQCCIRFSTPAQVIAP